MEFGMSSFSKKVIAKLLYFLRLDLLSELRELNISCITYMAAQLFYKFSKYLRKKRLKLSWKEH